MRRNFLRMVGLGLLVGLEFGWMSGDAATMSGKEDEMGEEWAGRAQMGPFALPAGARVERDLAYGGEPRQRLDVYIPARAKDAPVIFMVHGGGWTRGSKELWRVVKNKVTHWVGKGCLLVSINYRMSPEADPITQAHDVAQALAFVQSHLTSWGADPNNLIVMGHSSGAHLVSLLSADPTIGMPHGVKPWRATVSLDSAAMNIDQLMRRRHLALYDHVFRSDPDYWRAASPTLRLTAKPAVPMLLVCSSQRLDSCPQAHAFAARVNTLGGRAEVLPVDLTHPEINEYLGTPGAYTAAVDAFLASVGVH